MIRRMLKTAILALACSAVAANADTAPSACNGEDLIARMQRDEPARYQEMLDRFARIENNDSIFWKVEKPGLAASYLFGTAHVTDKRVLDRLDEVEPYLENARLLAVEIADLNPDMASQMSVIQQYGMLPEGETLDSRLSEEELKLMAEATAKHGMPWFSARRMKAGLLAVTMAIPPCAKIAIMRGEQVLDARLIEFARGRGIPVLGIETIAEQLSLVGKLDDEKMLAALVESARSDGSLAEDMYETTIRMHAADRIAMTTAFMEVKKADFPASSAAMESFEGPIIAARNHNMHERILPELEKGGVFVAVGAMHLPDESGLVKLVRDSGFAVTPVE